MIKPLGPSLHLGGATQHADMRSSRLLAYRSGKRIQWRTTTPKHHSGKRYMFQFHGSSAWLLKHRVNESSTTAALASISSGLASSIVRL